MVFFFLCSVRWIIRQVTLSTNVWKKDQVIKSRDFLLDAQAKLLEYILGWQWRMASLLLLHKNEWYRKETTSLHIFGQMQSIYGSATAQLWERGCLGWYAKDYYYYYRFRKQGRHCSCRAHIFMMIMNASLKETNACFQCLRGQGWLFTFECCCCCWWRMESRNMIKQGGQMTKILTNQSCDIWLLFLMMGTYTALYRFFSFFPFLGFFPLTLHEIPNIVFIATSIAAHWHRQVNVATGHSRTQQRKLTSLSLYCVPLVCAAPAPLEDISVTSIDLVEERLDAKGDEHLYVTVTRTDDLIDDDGVLLAERVMAVQVTFDVAENQQVWFHVYSHAPHIHTYTHTHTHTCKIASMQWCPCWDWCIQHPSRSSNCCQSWKVDDCFRGGSCITRR